MMTSDREVSVAVSIDTEEDDWDSYSEHGATVRNIAHLTELQELFDRWDARPTYLVNRAPLVEASSVAVLGELATRESVEIGAHCHPWNTPPLAEGGSTSTLMCDLSVDENRAKIEEVRRCLRAELGVEPKSFRAGRWAFGPTVAAPVVDTGFEIDCSVSPFIDWGPWGGPDFGEAPHRPYRFHPTTPLRPDASGPLWELPPTVGFPFGDQRRMARAWNAIVRSPLRHLKIPGLLDRTGLLRRRWLSPESSSAGIMLRIADAFVRSGCNFLQVSFHSGALLPGATPFVRDDADRARFLGDLESVLRHCARSGFAFRTLSETARTLAAADGR